MKELHENLTLGMKEKSFTNDKGDKITYNRFVLYVGGYVFDIHKCLSSNDKLLLNELFKGIEND